MTIKTKSIILVCFLKGFRGNPLYKGENKTSNWKPCLYTGDPFEGVRSLPPQTKIRYGPGNNMITLSTTDLLCACYIFNTTRVSPWSSWCVDKSQYASLERGTSYQRGVLRALSKLDSQHRANGARRTSASPLSFAVPSAVFVCLSFPSARHWNWNYITVQIQRGQTANCCC